MSHWDNISTEHLRGAGTPAEAAALFKAAVRMVEIEVFSYCNRLCWFCPNKDGSRIGSNTYMDVGLYESIVRRLADIRYDGMISYSRYNEPLADPVILDRIAFARQTLPEAKLHTNTNGDYLTPDLLARLRDAGLNTLNIQIYLKNFERYDHEKVRARGEQTLARLGAPARMVKDQPGVWLEWRIEYEGMTIRLYGRNFDVNGTSRGDTVDIAREFRRTAPCIIPAWAVYIDHDGSMVPCCNLRSDIPEHEDTVIARLSPAVDLFEAYAGARLASWRRALASFEEKQGVCRSCRFAQEPDTTATRAHSARLLADPVRPAP